MASLTNLVNTSNLQNNPIIKVKEFFDKQNDYKATKSLDKWRFVGYVLDLNFSGATIITNDTYKMMVGGIPRGSFLILVPADFSNTKPHFSLLRVKGVSSTPLSQQVQQTYFEMHKRSMPELDLWTQADLQWGALECDVLGMFYGNPVKSDELSFSGDVNNIVSAHRYEVYAPDEELLDLIVNGTVRKEFQQRIGKLRTMECLFEVEKQASDNIPVMVSMRDFMGCRTAMFGKTRLGKSNVVKLLAQGMIDATEDSKNVGQLIFDINGEYANDNSQDNNSSIYSANTERCEVYALTKRAETPSKELKLNFYEKPDSCKEIIGSFLTNEGKNSNYITAFVSVLLGSPDDIGQLDSQSDKIHEIRKIQIYWSILNAAGYKCNEGALKKLKGLYAGSTKPLEPHFSDKVRSQIYGDSVPPQPTNLDEMTDEYKKFAEYINTNGDITKPDGKPVFTVDEKALLGFLLPKTGSGPMMIANYREYHSPNASDFVKEIIQSLDEGKTIILDLGNASDTIRKYFSDLLSLNVFRNQEKKFVNNKLGDSYIQLYFEEAHNLFPPHTKDNQDVYSRFAKEGAKFHIGMVYSTQSPSTISQELLVQTENFFVGHLSSSGETNALTKTQVAFAGVEEDIMRSRTPGYMRMLTMSNRFVVPVQADLYDPKKG
jgi:hypothetical protein